MMRSRKSSDHSESAVTVLPDWLAVSTEGFAGMNAGRDPAHLVKELVQNALDALDEEKGGHVALDCRPAEGDGREGVVITCRDDGCGMSNLADIRTVFYTSKTDSRGRMGCGFKDVLCLAAVGLGDQGHVYRHVLYPFSAPTSASRQGRAEKQSRGGRSRPHERVNLRQK
jgi:hypothetical protein